MLSNSNIGGLKMEKHHQSGKSLVIQGSIVYFWEELKTLSWSKLSALTRILRGLLKMKFHSKKRPQLRGP